MRGIPLLPGAALGGCEPPGAQLCAGWFAFFHKGEFDPGGVFHLDRRYAGAGDPERGHRVVPQVPGEQNGVSPAECSAGVLLCQTMIYRVEKEIVAKNRRNRRKEVIFSGVASVFLNF